MKPTEEVTSMTANKFKDDDTLYFCIGTEERKICWEAGEGGVRE